MRKRIIAAAVLPVVLAASPAVARLWKPTPAQLAAEYVAIVHNKGDAGRVTIAWAASPAFPNLVLKQVLDKYVVISVTHTATGPDGTAVWNDIAGVQVMDGNNQALKEVAPDAVPPVLAGFTASAAAALRQNSQGKGKLQFRIYEAGAVGACMPGRLLVSYDGETYSFETPIPGCEKN